MKEYEFKWIEELNIRDSSQLHDSVGSRITKDYRKKLDFHSFYSSVQNKQYFKQDQVIIA